MDHPELWMGLLQLLHRTHHTRPGSVVVVAEEDPALAEEGKPGRDVFLDVLVLVCCIQVDQVGTDGCLLQQTAAMRLGIGTGTM